jgi:hypothetical protein
MQSFFDLLRSFYVNICPTVPRLPARLILPVKLRSWLKPPWAANIEWTGMGLQVFMIRSRRLPGLSINPIATLAPKVTPALPHRRS